MAPRWLVRRTVYQLLVAAACLSAWQWLPAIPNINHVFRFMSPFFISSPSQVAITVYHVATGTGNAELIWHPFLITLISALIGTFSAIVVGAVIGLLLSNNAKVADVCKPFIIGLNAVPRIAVIPIIILLVGSSSTADALTAFTVVVFLVFFNAFEGGLAVPLETLQNARLLGSRPWGIMWRVRMPYVLVWTFMSLPNALTFGLVGSVTAELFTGSNGVGEVLTAAVDTSNAALTFAVVVLVTAVGIGLVVGADRLRKRVLSWWDEAGAH